MQVKEDELDELLEAHLKKTEKVSIYKPRVEANMMNGVPTFKTTWSWWAFFGTWIFFLYRKLYVEAAIFFGVFVLSYFVPFLALVGAIISGVSAFFFYTKKFNKDLEIAGYEQKPLSEVKQSLQMLGGYNTWVIAVAVILTILELFIIFTVLITLSSLATTYPV